MEVLDYQEAGRGNVRGIHLSTDCCERSLCHLSSVFERPFSKFNGNSTYALQTLHSRVWLDVDVFGRQICPRSLANSSSWYGGSCQNLGQRYLGIRHMIAHALAVHLCTYPEPLALRKGRYEQHHHITYV